MYIGLMWFVGMWIGSVGCFGEELCMGIGRPYDCVATLAPPSYV